MNKKYGKFKVLDLFENRPVKNKLLKEKFILNGKYDVYSSDTTNNGVIGKIDKCEFEINKETPIYVIFGDHTRSFNIAKRSFSCMDNVKVLKPIKVMNEEQLLFILTLWKKEIRNLGYARHWSIAKDSIIQLPIKDSIAEKEKYDIDDIDYEYMEERIKELEEERIKELEEERIKELEKYLEVSGLENYELTKEDEEVLGRKVKFKEFKLSDIFDIKTTKSANKNNIEFDKNGEYDFIGRSSVNYGIQGKVNKMAYEPNDKDTFSLVQVGESCLLYREKEWYASQNIFILKSNDVNINKNHLYIQGAISKKLEPYKEAYTYPTLADVRTMGIHLPVDKQEQIDYEYMDNYIQAIKKKTIAGVVKYKDQVIEITKKVVRKAK